MIISTLVSLYVHSQEYDLTNYVIVQLNITLRFHTVDMTLHSRNTSDMHTEYFKQTCRQVQHLYWLLKLYF